jgi:hypothetical protein
MLWLSAFTIPFVLELSSILVPIEALTEIFQPVGLAFLSPSALFELLIAHLPTFASLVFAFRITLSASQPISLSQQ